MVEIFWPSQNIWTFSRKKCRENWFQLIVNMVKLLSPKSSTWMTQLVCQSQYFSLDYFAHWLKLKISFRKIITYFRHISIIKADIKTFLNFWPFFESTISLCNFWQFSTNFGDFLIESLVITHKMLSKKDIGGVSIIMKIINDIFYR